jgi:hypothetical protein
MSGTKEFASKQTFRGHKYVCAYKDTGVSEKRQPLSDQSGESSCVEHNLSASNKKIRGTSVITEVKVGENNLCKSKTDFTEDRNIVVGINLLCAFIKKK